MVQTQFLSAAGVSCDVLWEHYGYPAGKAGATPSHAHDEYQVCLSVNFPGEYQYRGARHSVPAQSVTILHPGEPHASRDPHDRSELAQYRLLYFSPGLFENRQQDSVERSGASPFFSNPVLTQPELFSRLTVLHKSLQSVRDPLRAETILTESLDFLASFSERTPFPPRHTRGEDSRIHKVRRYIEEKAHLPLHLIKLAEIAHLSPFHFARVFRAVVGMPPHAYQNQMRIQKAKRLLLHTDEISEIALQLGFTDQSHFTHVFRRLVGCTPARYRALV